MCCNRKEPGELTRAAETRVDGVPGPAGRRGAGSDGHGVPGVMVGGTDGRVLVGPRGTGPGAVLGPKRGIYPTRT